MGWRGGRNWEIGTDIYVLGMKRITDENLQHRELYSVLCGDVNEKEIQKGGDICTHVADSLCCTAEIDTTLQNNYTKIKLIKKEYGSSPCVVMKTISKMFVK